MTAFIFYGIQLGIGFIRQLGVGQRANSSLHPLVNRRTYTGKALSEVGENLRRSSFEFFIGWFQYRERRFPDRRLVIWVGFAADHHVPMQMGHRVSEQPVVQFRIRVGLLQRLGHAGSVIHELMLQLWREVVQFGHMVLIDQDCRATEVLPVAVKHGCTDA
jgi:hypothetical protein